jgi:hypothetical protein
MYFLLGRTSRHRDRLRRRGGAMKRDGYTSASGPDPAGGLRAAHEVACLHPEA